MQLRPLFSSTSSQIPHKSGVKVNQRWWTEKKKKKNSWNILIVLFFHWSFQMVSQILFIVAFTQVDSLLPSVNAKLNVWVWCVCVYVECHVINLSVFHVSLLELSLDNTWDCEQLPVWMALHYSNTYDSLVNQVTSVRATVSWDLTEILYIYMQIQAHNEKKVGNKSISLFASCFSSLFSLEWLQWNVSPVSVLFIFSFPQQHVKYRSFLFTRSRRLS